MVLLEMSRLIAYILFTIARNSPGTIRIELGEKLRNIPYSAGGCSYLCYQLYIKYDYRCGI